MAEEQIEETTPENPPLKKGKKGFLKIVAIGVVAALLAGGAGYYFYGKKMLGHAAEKQTETKGPEKLEVGPTVALEPFIINVSGNSSRFVKISVAMELKNEKAVEHAKKTTPVVRDAMLSVLGAKTPETFMDVAGRAAIKKELFDNVNRVFPDGALKAIYITDIIMQ